MRAEPPTEPRTPTSWDRGSITQELHSPQDIKFDGKKCQFF